MLDLQHAYGGWLATIARSFELPVLEARPWDTLEQRIIDVLDRPGYLA